MNPEPPDLLSEELIPQLAAYDEHLAGESLSLDDPPAPGNPEERNRLRRLRACIDLLRQAHPKQPAVAAAPPGYPGQHSQTFGRFRIVRELGRGGFGVVFLADDPKLRRQVALKVPKSETLADPDLRERFLREARAAGGLEHANVVPVYEAGQVGLVCYLVSAYCPGPTLAGWLREQGGVVPAPKAAALIACLAEAVQHAHSHGVFHRDLKPANVLLAPRAEGADGPQSGLEFTPRLTDFGLAKLVDADLDQASTTGGLLGTPLYMSPEQAEGKRQGFEAATDVYALGVILYELLTGRPPFQGTTVLDTLQQVRTQDPVPPARFHPGLPRDLEIICLKCLEKDPRKRYASAAGLADDLRRFLEGKPILARATPAWERAWKWGRRRPVVAVSGAVSIVAVLGLLILWGSFTVRLRTEHNLVQQNFTEAKKQWHRAEANQEKTLEAVDRFLTRVGETRLAGVPRMEPVQRELLTDALEFFQGFLQEQDNPDPRLRRDAARAYHRTARIKRLLGKPKEAEQDYQRAVQLLRQLVAEDPDEPSYQNDLAKSLSNLGQLAEALELKKRLVAEHPEVAEYQRSLALTHASLGLKHRQAGRLGEAEAAYRTGLDLLEPLVRDHPDVLEHKAALALLLNNLAALWSYSNKKDRAEQTMARVRDVYLEMVRMPRGAIYRKELVVSYANLAITYQETGQLEEGRQCLEEALGLMKQLVQDYPDNPRNQGELARKHSHLAAVYSHTHLPSLKQPQKAARELQNALEILKGLVRAYPHDAGYRHQLAEVYIDLASLPESRAREDNLQAVAILEPLLVEHPGDVLIVTTLALACFNLAICGANQQEFEVQLNWLARADKLLSDALKRVHHPPAALLLGRLLADRSRILNRANRHREALADLDRAVALGTFEPLQIRCERAHTRCRLGDHAGGASDANLVADQKPFVREPVWYCQLAGVFAAIGRTVASDGKLPPAERARLTAQYEDRAMAFLARAFEAGRLKSRAQLEELKTLEHLDRLRARPEFQKWLREAEDKLRSERMKEEG